MMGRMTWCSDRPAAVLALTLAAGVAAAQDAGPDPDRGRALAERWCAECHLLPGQEAGPDAGPPLAAVAVESDAEAAALEAWLFDPHEPMPDLELAPAQIGHIVAYLKAAGDGEGTQ